MGSNRFFSTDLPIIGHVWFEVNRVTMTQQRPVPVYRS
jgi:hypothetical protein